METSELFRSKQDAQKYFDVLDQDGNGAVSFTEFLAPLLTYLSEKQVHNLTKDDKITMMDLTILRDCFEDLLKKEGQKKSNQGTDKPL